MISIEVTDEWRWTATRITKYNPQYRDDAGIYTKDEWTSFSDIGKSFDGVELTSTEYFKTEASYICTILLILEEIGCTTFKINIPEKYTESAQLSGQMLEVYNSVADGVTLGIDDLPTLMKLILRNYMWCELICTSDVIVRFGYDYYMYVNGVDFNNASRLRSRIEIMDLFIDYQNMSRWME